MISYPRNQSDCLDHGQFRSILLTTFMLLAGILFVTSAQAESRLNAVVLPTGNGGVELAVSWQGEGDMLLTGKLEQQPLPAVELVSARPLGAGVSLLALELDPFPKGLLILEAHDVRGVVTERWIQDLEELRAIPPLFIEPATVSATGFEDDGFAWMSEFVGPGLNGPNATAPPYALVVWDDGSGPRLVLGGGFTVAGSLAVNNIVQWDGAEWSALGSGLGPGHVEALVVYQGNLIAAGSFTESGGELLNRIARWDGSEWLPLDAGFDDTVRALSVYNEDLIAAGDFTQAGGASANRIARWNGVEWSSFGSGLNNMVHDLVVYEDDLIAGGFFTQAGGSVSLFVSRWDGSSWSPVGKNGPNGFVTALSIYDGELIAGGGFDQAGGEAGISIASWNGSDWSIVGGGVGGAAAVRSLAVFDGKLIVGGNGFAEIGGITVNNIAAWDGSNWSALEGLFGTGVSPSGFGVWSLAEFEGALIVGGQFGEAGGVVVNNVARWDGTEWSLPAGLSALGSGLNANVWAAIEYDGDLIVGGDFNYAGNSQADHIARWDGDTWHPLGGGTNDQVRALAVHQGGLIAGGTFTEVGEGIAASAVARWDGTAWSPFGTGEGLGGNVFALAVYDDELIAGGTMGLIGRVARWDGTAWLPLGNSPPGGGGNNISALAVFDGTLIAGGSFTQAGGEAAWNIARWDGSQWSALGAGLCAQQCGSPIPIPVHAIAAFDGDLYAGGDFVQSGGEQIRGIARWNGEAWSQMGDGISWGTSFPAVRALVPYRDRLVAGGRISHAGEVVVNHLAAWDGMKWSPLAGPAGTGLDMGGGVNALTVFSATAAVSEKLVAGGTFSITGGVANWHLGFYAGDGLAVIPDSLEFGWVAVGDAHGPLTLTLSNLSLEEVNVNSILVPGSPFSEVGGTCTMPPFALEPGSSCEVAYTFSPISTGLVSALVTIESDAASTPDAAILTGIGSDGPVVIDPQLLDFGTVIAGETGGPLTATLANASSDVLNVSQISVAEHPFGPAGGTCEEPPFSLNPFESCTLVYTFQPDESGPGSQTISVVSDAPGSPDSFTLEGEGLVRELTVMPPGLNFGVVTLGDIAGPLSITLTNTGDADVSTIEVSNPVLPFAVNTSDCGSSLSPGQSCVVDLTFNPTVPDQYLEAVEISSNASSSPNSVLLLGMGTGAVVDLNPDELWGLVSEGQVATGFLTIGNLGNEPLDWVVTEQIEPAAMPLRPVAVGKSSVPTTGTPGEGGPEAFRRFSEKDSREVRPGDFTPSGTLTSITHSHSMALVDNNSVACSVEGSGGALTVSNHFIRVFDLSDFGIPGEFEISEVTFGVQGLTVNAEITVNLYLLDGALEFGNMDLIGSTTQMLEAQILSLVTTPVAGVAPINSTLVVEILAPDLLSVSGAFFPGSNHLGETAPSFIAAPDCDTPEPVSYAEIGAPDVHLVMTVSGQVEPADCALPSWLGVDPDAGIVSASGSQLVTITLGDPELPAGNYEANLCLAHSDPQRPFSIVPVTLVVEEAPLVEVAPGSLTFVLAQGVTDTQSLAIGNAGTAELEWFIEQAANVGSARRLLSGHDLMQGTMSGGWSEGFDHIDLLPSAGWSMINNSEPLGLTDWLQGDPELFAAHEGAANAYIAADLFNTVIFGGAISNWLITPEIELFNGTQLRFWTRATEGSTRPDRLEVRLSTAGDSADVGTGAESVGDFAELLLSVNEGLEVGGYPEEWTEFVVAVEGISGTASGRLAFRYFVTDAGLQGANSRYIGIDTVSVEQPPSGCDLPEDIAWLDAEPASGTTSPGTQSHIAVLVDTDSLALGDYEAGLCINSNDPLSPIVSVPVSLTVIEPFPNYESNPSPGSVLDFGSVSVGIPSDPLALDIGNIDGQGLAPGSNLHILDASTEHSAFAVTILNNGPFAAGEGPDGVKDIEVICTPDQKEAFTGILLIETNDPDQPADGFAYVLNCEGAHVPLPDPVFSDRFEHQ